MILIQETDDGTRIREPHIHAIAGGPAMTITCYLNGRYSDTYEYRIAAWPKHRRELLAEGFVESDEKPELATGIDQSVGVVAVTSLFRAELVEPGTGDPDNPAGSYVEQANTALYRAGYLRLNNWWNSFDGLTTVVVRTPESLIPTTAEAAGIVPALKAATEAIRGKLGIDSPDASPTVAADHLRLCEDPAWKGFGAGLVEIVQHGYPAHVKVAAEELLKALDFAARGEAGSVRAHTGAVFRLLQSGEF